MRQDRGITQIVVVAFLIVGGLVALFFLPLMLTATPPPDQNVPASLPRPLTYEPAVQQLLDTTYLGHANNLPDPGEPAEVLQKYLEQNAHGYQDQLTTQGQKLSDGLVAWKALVQRYPNSRHARVALAKHYRAKAIASGDSAYTRQAADAYIRAVEIGLGNGRIRYTRELSELLVELGDRKGLDEVFGRILAQPKDMDSDYYYLALVHYADGLARFSDDRAWGYFEQAIALHPENNLEAINRYAQHLLTRGQAQQALDVLDTRLTPQQRVRFILPAQLRKQAMAILGLDTASADAEIALLSQRLEGGWSFALPAEHSSKTADTETAVMALSAQDPRVSAIFGISSTDNTVRKDAIFSPNSAINDRWPNMSPTVTGKKLATLKWPNSSRAGLVRIGTDNICTTATSTAPHGRAGRTWASPRWTSQPSPARPARWRSLLWAATAGFANCTLTITARPGGHRSNTSAVSARWQRRSSQPAPSFWQPGPPPPPYPMRCG